MLALESPRWSELDDAYGIATGIPRHLRAARIDRRPGYEVGSAWFALWSALCHQGDIYTASYAALPHLIAIGASSALFARFDPLHLAAFIEIARLEGRGPEMPADLSAAYAQALLDGARVAERSLPDAWDDDSHGVFAGSLAAFKGDARAALAVLDPDDEE